MCRSLRDALGLALRLRGHSIQLLAVALAAPLLSSCGGTKATAPAPPTRATPLSCLRDEGLANVGQRGPTTWRGIHTGPPFFDVLVDELPTAKQAAAFVAQADLVVGAAANRYAVTGPSVETDDGGVVSAVAVCLGTNPGGGARTRHPQRTRTTTTSTTTSSTTANKPSVNERAVRISVSPDPFYTGNPSMVVRFTTVGPAAVGRYYAVNWSTLNPHVSKCSFASYSPHFLAGGAAKAYKVTLHPITAFGGDSFCAGPSAVEIATLAYADKTKNRVSGHTAGRLRFTVLTH